MTPIQKAKEIAEEKYPYPELNPEINNTLARFRIDALREGYAAALLSGEDWKEDGWVSVDEKLPKKNEEYIVCGKGFEGRIVTTMEWKNKKWFSDVYQKYIEQIKITHWQPLPEPPKP